MEVGPRKAQLNTTSILIVLLFSPIASVIRMMSGALIVIIRSMLSKTVQPDEVGQTFALLGIIESLVPLVMAPVYAITYHSTVFVFPGAFFFMSAGIMLPAEVIFL